MKKIAIALATAMVLAMGCLLVGCSEESPSDVTKTYLDALKSKDSDAYAKVYADGATNPLDGKTLLNVDSSKTTDTQKEVLGEMLDKVLDFDYTIGEEKVSDDKATVDVTVKTYQFGDAFTKAFKSYFSKAMASGMTDTTELSDLMMECFSDELDKLKDKSYEKTVTFNLTNTDDGWTIDELSDAQVNALMGGIEDSMKTLESKMSE